jgi:predicted Rossmann-fold nucleotide-binding protein
VRTADALVAVGGAYGTLSEIAFALKAGKRVVGIGSWGIEGVERAEEPAAAVEAALDGLS